MMMDLTPIFVQMMADIKRGGGDQKTSEDNQSLSPSSKSKSNSHFSTKLSELVASVTYMRDYLLANRKDYINIYNSLLSMASTMTDEQRDQIDRDVADFIRLSSDVVKILKAEAKTRQSKQRYEHECHAIAMVEEYIKAIGDFHNKQKALRLRRNLDSQNFFRLSRSITKGPLESPSQQQQQPPQQQQKGLASPKTPVVNNRNISGSSNNKPEQNSFLPTNGSLRKRKGGEGAVENNSTRTPTTTKKYNFLLEEEEEEAAKSAQNDTSKLGFSAEELKMFKDEGTRIYQEMNSMNDEVQQIGQKLTEIARLQEAFSENVLKQDADLISLNSTTIASTESIREGNEQLREAMRKNAGFRVFVLFFITTLAFVVLFLDWYNG